MYALSLLHSYNIKSLTLNTSTVDCYLFVATKVIRAATFSKCVEFFDPRYDHFGTKAPDLDKVIRESKRWESMPRRREPVTLPMLLYMASTCMSDPDCIENAHFD